MAEPADINVDELRRRARRRLVGAVVLALGVAVVVPMLLETEQKPLGEDVSVKIPPVDDGKFVNRLNDKPATGQKPDEASAAKSTPDVAAAPGAATAPAATAAPAVAEPTPGKASKYDTHVPETPDVAAKLDATAASGSASANNSAAAASSPPTAATSASAAKAAEPALSAPPAKPVARPPTPPQVRSAEGAPTPSSAHERFAVQLAAFADDKGANSLASRLKRAGYTAYTEPLKTSKGTLWRVRVGPYPSREAALAARDKLKTEGQSGIVAAAR